MYKILSKVSQFELMFVFVALALPGVLTVLIGCAYEVWAQNQLLELNGADALRAYQAYVDAQQLSPLQVIWHGITFTSVSMSGFIQGYGFALVFLLMPFCLVVVLLARAVVWAKRTHPHGFSA